MKETTPCNPSETTVVLLLGGTSGEREISLDSGRASASALRDEGFTVIEVDPAEPDYRQQILDAAPDVVFICLHGKGGEDGVIQAVLEEMGLPYTGSGVQASATAMDKAAAKDVYISAGVPTPDVVTLNKGEEYSLDQIVAKVGERSAVKPATEGSALGVHLVHDPSELPEAIEAALAIDDKVLVERFVQGVEVTVAVLGNDDPEALPVIEIVPTAEFYDFESKYAPGGSTHIIPARISDEETEACQRYAMMAHAALGCRGVSRSDLIVDEQGKPWMLETNTIPGMTSTSLLPDAARKVGIEFGALCRLLVELALEDGPRDNSSRK